MRFSLTQQTVQTPNGWGSLFTVMLCLVLASASSAQVDNTLIAFTSFRDGNGEIYVMNADGKKQRNLTQNPAEDCCASWSLDGRKIVFTSFRDGNAEIYVMDADGGNPQNLTKNPAGEGGADPIHIDTNPSWSPDGTKIAFKSHRAERWNPEIYVMDADGGNPKNITQNSTPVGHCCPSWSPDGKQIIFTSHRDGNKEIYVMNADGKKQRNLTQIVVDDNWASWSPDGKQIVFTSFRDDNGEIHLMDNDGGNVKNLTKNPEDDCCPSWSPSGTKIAFMSRRDGDVDIHVMNADGKNPQNLTNSPGIDTSPSWSRAAFFVVSPKGKLATLWGQIKRNKVAGF